MLLCPQRLKNVIAHYFARLISWRITNIQLQLDFVITDFEKGAINAICAEFPEVQPKGCHFHLSQSIYRRI